MSTLPYRLQVVIALNQMDSSEEATIYLMRLSGLIGAPFTLLNYSGFVLFAGIFLWIWDAKMGTDETGELTSEELSPWFTAFVVEFLFLGVVCTLPVNARVIYTLYAVKQERALEQSAIFARSSTDYAEAMPQPGPERDLVVPPEPMLAELEAFLHVRGLEHAALPDFIRWLLVRLGPDCDAAPHGARGGAHASAAGGRRLAPTTRRRTELLFNREIDRRLDADLASMRACRYKEPSTLLPPRVGEEVVSPRASQCAPECASESG